MAERRNSGGGAADPRELVSTGGHHLANGTVATFGDAPLRRRPAIARITPGERERFEATGRELDALGLPKHCWNGGPLDAAGLERVMTRNAGLDAVDMAYPFYENDPAFTRWRRAEGRTEEQRHRANCLVTERWSICAMAIAPTGLLPQLQRLRSAAVANQRFEVRRKVAAETDRSQHRADFQRGAAITNQTQRTETDAARATARARYCQLRDDGFTERSAVKLVFAEYSARFKTRGAFRKFLRNGETMAAIEAVGCKSVHTL